MNIGFSAEKFVYSPAKSGVRGSWKIKKTYVFFRGEYQEVAAFGRRISCRDSGFFGLP